jgi:ferritin
MLDEKMVSGMNYQINREMYSAYFYLGMSAWASDNGLNGIANWFDVQVREELSHAQKFYDYLLQQGAKIELQAIEQPPQDFSTAEELFERTLEHEKKVTDLINKLVATAREVNDNASEIFLQWFVTEQVEEESSASEMLQRFRIAGADGNALLMLDRELSGRTFTPPAAE